MRSLSRREDERDCEGDASEGYKRERKFARGQEQRRQCECHQSDEPPFADAFIDQAEGQVDRGRNRKDQHELEVTFHMPQDVGREAEQIAPEEARHEAAGDVPAEQERKERSENRTRQHQQVVRNDWAERDRDRRAEDARQRAQRRAGGGEVDPVRGEQRVGDQRVQSVKQRVRPPRQAPHIDRRIGPVAQADVRTSEMREHVHAEVPDRDRRVQCERDRGLAASSRKPITNDLERPWEAEPRC